MPWWAAFSVKTEHLVAVVRTLHELYQQPKASYIHVAREPHAPKAAPKVELQQQQLSPQPATSTAPAPSGPPQPGLSGGPSPSGQARGAGSAGGEGNGDGEGGALEDGAGSAGERPGVKVRARVAAPAVWRPAAWQLRDGGGGEKGGAGGCWHGLGACKLPPRLGMPQAGMGAHQRMHAPHWLAPCRLSRGTQVAAAGARMPALRAPARQAAGGASRGSGSGSVTGATGGVAGGGWQEGRAGLLATLARPYCPAVGLRLG